MSELPTVDLSISLSPTPNRRKKRYRVAFWSGLVVIVVTALFSLFSYLTNPFVRFSIFNDAIEVNVADGELQIIDNRRVVVRDNRWSRQLAFSKSGYHMVSTFLKGGHPVPGDDVEQIIDSIHALRFSEHLPFLISGDHFSVFYPRSLGIFYHSLLDPRTARSEDDWTKRQAIYLKSLTYALGVFEASDSISTTIVPIGPNAVVLMNIYAPPSDTLYSLLYALRVMQETDEIVTRYPFETAADALPQTDYVANYLVTTYMGTLQRHYQNFWQETYDPVTGLVKAHIILSGTKDSVARHAAFYDNVMLWKTTKLAQELGIVTADSALLESLKQRIITAYWDDQAGYFKEELGINGKQASQFSGDWLIAYQTGFLDPNLETDRRLLERSVLYTRAQQLDQPFGMRYNLSRDISNYFWPVKFGTPNYATTAIWSHWGMEYSKLLAHLALVTENEEYGLLAQQQVDAYAENILEYRGFPELYDTDGSLYANRFYKSVRSTGWVVNFEQTRAMVEWVNSELADDGVIEGEVVSDQ